MDKLNEILEKNELNIQKRSQAGIPEDPAPVDATKVIPIRKRQIGDVINIDNTLYKVRIITRKDIILRQLSQQESQDFLTKINGIRKANWKKMWEEKVENNPNTTYKNTEDTTPEGGYWYCKKHFIEKYGFEPRMYKDVYSLRPEDYCAICKKTQLKLEEPNPGCYGSKLEEDREVVIEPPPELKKVPKVIQLPVCPSTGVPNAT